MENECLVTVAPEDYFLGPASLRYRGREMTSVKLEKIFGKI